MKQKNIILEHKDLFLWMLAVCIISIISITWNTEWFRASVLQVPTKFDGTVMPTEKTPNWITWWWNNKITKFSEIKAKHLIKMPKYSLAVWWKWPASIKPNNAEKIAKLTYPVVYLWNYDIENRVEWKGSHLAVDIRIPSWTPLRAVANWKIVKAVSKNSWFWKHIVIEVPNAPKIWNKKRKTTYYVSYSHMSSINVKNWQIVKKWQLIWNSWNSWTSTTPHLHFQIDEKSSPWHPYWPFSSKEAYAANLNFFTAVREWLWIENAKKHTINPMKWVEENLNNNISPVKKEEEKIEKPSFSKFKISWNENFKTDWNITLTVFVEDKNWKIIEDFRTKDSLKISSTSNTARFSKILRFKKWIANVLISNRQAEKFIFKIKYENKEFTKEIESILSENKKEENSAEVVKKEDVAINNNENLDLEAKKLEEKKIEEERVKKEKLDKIAEEEKKKKEELKKQAEKKESKQEKEAKIIDKNIKILIQWENKIEVWKRLILDVYVNDKKWAFAKIERNYAVWIAWVWEVKPSVLTKWDFISSKWKIAFESKKEWEAIILINWEEFEIEVFWKKEEKIIENNEENIIKENKEEENLHWTTEKIIEEIEEKDEVIEEKIIEEKELFSDVSTSHKNYEAIKYLKEKWIVWWYADWSFKPTKFVSRVEALKMIFSGLKLDTSNPTKLTFPDTSNDAWYSIFIGSALKKWIVKGYPDWTFWPAKWVNRSEYYKILLIAAEIVPTTPKENPFADVPADSWFGSYVAFSKDANLINIEWENFYPSKWVSRAEVAESLFNLIKFLEK